MAARGALALLGGAVLSMLWSATAFATPIPKATWQTNGTVRAIRISNGVIYLGGDFTGLRPPGAAEGTETVARGHAAAIDARTGRLLRWNPRVNGRVSAIAVFGKRVYLGGVFSKVGGRPRRNVAAVGRRKGHIKPWNPGADNGVNVIRIGRSGGVYLGGEFGRVAGATRHRLARVSQTGALTSWAPSVSQVGGAACPPRCHAKILTMAFSPRGRGLYIGGHFGKVDGVARNEAAKISLPHPHQVMAFNPNIYANANCPSCTTIETHRVYTIIPTSDRVFTCGGYWQVNGNRRSFNVSAFDPHSGRLLSTLTEQDDGDTPGCTLRAGILYVGGHFNVAGPDCQPNHTGTCSTRHHVAAFDTRDNKLLSWNPDANSPHGVFVVTHSHRRVAFGGFFTHFGGRPQQGIAVYTKGSLP
ncbi:MAG TPA: hypothetical protein VGI83_02475 [Gemmatimonadales bacterium]